MRFLPRFFTMIIPMTVLSASVPVFGAEENISISETLFRDILNSHELKLFPFIAPIKLPFGISEHMFMLGLSVLLILIFFITGLKKHNLRPKGTANLIEILVLFIRDDVVYPVMGKKRGDHWLPFFLSMFIFLFTVNIIGLIPAFKTATGNISVTSAMALIVFILTFAVGFKELGFPGFFKNIYPHGAGAVIGVFVVILEFIGFFTKSIVLSLRLFANMFAGHLAILSFLVLIFVINPFFGFISVPFAVFTYLLEVLVAFLQAFVFTLLSCIFITMASTPEGE